MMERWEEEYHLYGKFTGLKDHGLEEPIDDETCLAVSPDWCDACQRELEYRNLIGEV